MLISVIIAIIAITAIAYCLIHNSDIGAIIIAVGTILCILTVYVFKTIIEVKEKELEEKEKILTNKKKLEEKELSKQKRLETKARKEQIQKLVNILDFSIKQQTFNNIEQTVHNFLQDKQLIKTCSSFIQQNNGIFIIDYLTNFSNSEQSNLYITEEYINLLQVTTPQLKTLIKLSNYNYKNNNYLWTHSIQTFQKALLNLLNDNQEYFSDNILPELSYTFEHLSQELENNYQDINLNTFAEFIFLLIENNRIKNSFEDVYSIIALLWILHIQYLENLYFSLCDKFDIDPQMPAMDIAHKLYQVDQNSISLFFTIDKYLTNLDKTFFACLNEVIPEITHMLDKIKRREKLRKLEENYTSKSLSTTINDIDLMSGSEFESFVAKLFKKMGYKTTITKTSGDQGVDVLAQKADFIVAIQAKCYNGVVGNHAIMEAVAGMNYYKANKCMVITNSHFTKSAKELAKANNVELWDRQTLIEKLEII